MDPIFCPPTVSKPMQLLKNSGYSILSGIIAGLSTALLLHLLDQVTHWREMYPPLVWGLPLVGVLIVWSYRHYGHNTDKGYRLILDEIHDPKQTLPLRMSPFILISTLATHLFGGSAGREGTAVQMGASLSDAVGKQLGISAQARTTFLMTGAAAGFGAALGTPLAGMVFGMEVLYKKGLRISAWYPCLIASLVAYAIGHLLKVTHTPYSPPMIPDISLRLLVMIVVAGLCFGGIARLFIHSTHALSRRLGTGLRAPLIGGCLVLVIYAIVGHLRHAGLGLPVIQDALQTPLSFWDPFYKFILTCITLGSGFKGGEFTPLVFIGSTFGNALAPFLSLPHSFMAALGFAAVFGAAANTPMACAVMAAEIFGWTFFPYVLVCTYVAYWASGTHGIYAGQR